MRIHAVSLISIVAAAFIVSAISGCSTLEQSPPTATKTTVRQPERITETMVSGEWTIAVELTADVLARAQFGTQQTITIKPGTARPETNTVAKPFNQKVYDESKAFWTQVVVNGQYTVTNPISGRQQFFRLSQ